MNVMALGVGTVLLAIASAFGTRAFLSYATRARLVDVPNARSSHAVPVPRGGGVVFSVLTLVGTAFLPGAALPTSVLFACAAMLLLGLVDDRLSLPALFRLFWQIALASFVVWSLGPLPPLVFASGVSLDSGALLSAAFVMALVWLVNLYNFMDGIDALAGGEGLFVAIVGALVCTLGGVPGLAVSLLALAACLLGFLVWNVPPAKIFMGDAGSVFLGFFFGAVTVLSHAGGGPSAWVWLILLGVFCADTTVTLIRRIRHGQRPLEAHRTHAYQYLARRHGSHARISLGVLVVNLFWLAPCALLATRLPDHGFALALLAYSPLVVAVVRSGAGLPERASPT